VGGSANRLRLELNVLNVFNQKSATHVYSELNRNRSTARINLANTNLANGYDYRAMITARPDAAGPFDPRFGQEDLFREGTSAHLLVKWTF
jgi:hypothetical protein